ncbi:MAG: PorT family protein [Candidatus Symbiothrix sp.]|jgi:hypothetical protein|nr:PorT family protein [Candidatus Symbiothrix sp.]
MKCLLISILFLLIPFCLFAQFSVGVKASPILFGSWTFSTGDIENDTIATGGWAPINFGAFFNYSFKEHFAIQAEIKPMVESISCDITDKDIDGGWFDFTFIEIPLLFQYKGQSRFRWFAEAGFSLKFLVLADHHFGQDKYDAKEYFNNVIFKSNIGGGIMFDITKNFTLIADTRLGYDITPIGKKSIIEKVEKEWSFDNIRPLHLTVISIGIAYKF